MDNLHFLAEVPSFCCADGSLDTEAVRLCINRLIDGGYTHIAVAGIAGEYENLTLSDQRALVSCAVEAAAGRAAIAAGAFDAGTEKAAERILEHRQLGCRLHLCIASHYFGLAHEDEFLRHMSVLRHADTGLLLLDSAAHTGFTLGQHALAQLAASGHAEAFICGTADPHRLSMLNALGNTIACEELALLGSGGINAVHSRLAFLFPHQIKHWAEISLPVRQALLSILDSSNHPASAVKYAAYLLNLCSCASLFPPSCELTADSKKAIEHAVLIAKEEEKRWIHVG